MFRSQYYTNIKWELHNHCECKKCYGSWYYTHQWLIKVANLLVDTNIPEKCDCVFGNELSNLVEKYAIDRWITYNDNAFKAYVMIFKLWFSIPEDIC